MGTAEARREERALRRAGRVEIEAQRRKAAIYLALETVAVFVVLYASMWLGYLWASI
jgi:hypothetical protein